MAVELCPRCTKGPFGPKLQRRRISAIIKDKYGNILDVTSKCPVCRRIYSFSNTRIRNCQCGAELDIHYMMQKYCPVCDYRA